MPHEVAELQYPALEPACVYRLDDGGEDAAPAQHCGQPAQPGSSYCPYHHARCHLRRGSRAEQRELRLIERLAAVAGGRYGAPVRTPPPLVLRRFDRAARAFLRPHRSRIVPKETAMKKRIETTSAAGGETAPTLERQGHGPVERVGEAIADTRGRASRPYRGLDTLTLMERRGTITSGMRQAGEDFRARFALAQLDPLRALDLSVLRLGEPDLRRDKEAPGARIEAARRAVWRAIQAVGGIASPAGSCLWHVLGWERTVKDWALEQGWSGRRISPETASGILVAALGALEAHQRSGASLTRSHFVLDKTGSI